MESNNFRSSLVLSNLNTNVQDDAVKQLNPLSVSTSLKSSSSSSDSEIPECDDQENKPPESVEFNKSSSPVDGFQFKKPLPREMMIKEDNTLNSLIDDLSHLKLECTSASEKRFSFNKWTTPLKKKTESSNENYAFSDSASFEKNNPSFVLNDEETVQNSTVTFSSNQPDKEISISHHDDDCSEYYDCSDEGNAIGEQAHVSTADSSFHSVPEKEHLAAPSVGNSTFMVDDTESLNRTSVAEINRTQGDDQAYILEKYLDEQDFKLHLSISDVSFNAITGGIDFELGERQNICSRTENPSTGSLFNFENQEKTELRFTRHQVENDVTIKPDQFDDVSLFTKGHAPQTEEALFNLLTDQYVENETRSLFDTNPEENIFALGRLSQAGYLPMNTVEEEDALMQLSTRKSLLLQLMQSCDNDSDQHNANESQENNSTPMDGEVEAVDENTEPDENKMVSNSSPQTNTMVIQLSEDVEISEENSYVNTNQDVETKRIPGFEETFIKNKRPLLNKLNKFDEIFTAINENSEKLNKTTGIFKKSLGPSSLNATVDSESVYDDSLYEKLNIIIDSESTRDIDRNLEQNNDLPELNQTVDLEASKNLDLKIEEPAYIYQDANVYVNFKKTQMICADLVEQSQNILKSDESVNSKKDLTICNEMKKENLISIQDCNENFELDQDTSKLNLTSSVLINTAISEKISEICINLEKSSESVNSNRISIIGENLTEQCLKSSKNLTMSSETPEYSSEESPDQNEIYEHVSSDYPPETVKKLYTQCQEFLMDCTIFETTELIPETINKKSSNQEPSIKSFNSETSRTSVINVVGTSQVSSVDMIINSEKTDETVDEKSFDQEKCNELGNSGTVENLTEQAPQLALLIDERINRSDDEKSNEYANSKPASLINESFNILNKTQFKSIRTVSFDLDITRIIKNAATKDQDDTGSRKTAELKTTQVTNKNQELMELSKFDDSEVTLVSQSYGDGIAKSGDLNEIIELEIGGASYNDSLTPVQTSKNNEMINFSSTHVIDENIAKDSDNLNKPIELELEIIENTSLTIQRSSHLGNTVDMEVTQTFKEKTNDSVDLGQKNTATTTEINSIVLNKEMPRQYHTVDVEITQKFEENPVECADLDYQNGTTDLKTSTVSEVDTVVLIQELSRSNEPVDMEVTRIIEENSKDFTDNDRANLNSFKLNITDDLKKSCSTCNDTIPCTSEAVAMEGNVTVLPIFSTESILENSSSRIDVSNEDLMTEANQNCDLSNIEIEIEVDKEHTATSSNQLANKTLEELQLSYCSNSKSCDNTVIMPNSPVQRCNSPARFDNYAASMPEPASPIPPNSPIELNDKWQTLVDLSSVVNNLECLIGRDSASNSSDEMDVTDPVDSNIAPEILRLSELPPGLNRSISNLESIPELNENDANEEQNILQMNVEQDTINLNSLEEKNIASAVKPEAVFNQTYTSICCNDLGSTHTQTSPEPKTASVLNEFTAVTAPKNLDDSIFKTPITSKLPSRSDLSALNDSNFNADYCSARSTSAKSTQSRHSLVSPRLSIYKSSPSIYSPFFSPNRRHRQATPRTLGDVPPSLLDMSIGCFENYTANQVGSNTILKNYLDKTVDVDDEPQLEETKLLYIDDPCRKVNVKTQTHDTELIELRLENSKLKEDIETMVKLTQVLADKETELRNALHALAHNESELKKAVQQLEDNNRILNNRYDTLTEYSNLLLASRNAELDKMENKVRILDAQLQEYNKKPKASSK